MSSLRIIKNFKRPYWITRDVWQNHRDKKEYESLDKVVMYESTDTDLATSILGKLGNRFLGKKTMYDAGRSPYVYGTNVSALTIMKKSYLNKYKDFYTPYTIAGMDTEADVDTRELYICSVAFEQKLVLYVSKRMLPNPNDAAKQLNYLYDKYMPDVVS